MRPAVGPVFAIVAFLAAMFVACAPTLAHSGHHPRDHAASVHEASSSKDHRAEMRASLPDEDRTELVSADEFSSRRSNCRGHCCGLFGAPCCSMSTVVIIESIGETASCILYIRSSPVPSSALTERIPRPPNHLA
jgi:hypothetical protein